MSKIERKYLAHFIKITDPDKGEVYERLGKDLEEFSAEMGAQVEKKFNILGETSVCISAYDKSASVQTFYADPDSRLFVLLQKIIDGGLLLDDLKTEVVEVKLWGEGSSNAVKEEAYIEILSYGGNASGYQIPFKLHYTGKRVGGTFDLSTMVFSDK